MASFLRTETVHVAHPKVKVFCRYVPEICCRSIKSMSILDILHDSILLNIQERLSHPLDLQSWALSCKRFYALEAGSRRHLSLLRLHTFPVLAQRYPSLQHLDLSSCTFVSDEGLGYVALSVGKRLLSLNLSSVCTFTYLGLILLAKECISLLHLDLSKCLQVGELGIMALAHIHTLQSLKLNGCVEVSDSSLAFLAFHCRRLRSLCLKWCIRITDGALFTIGAYCLSLQELDVSYTEITNASLSAICKLRSLEKLRMVACSQPDDEGLLCLRNGSRSLQTLDVSRCRNISYGGIMELANGEFPLKHIMMSYCYPVADPLLQSFANLKALHSIRFDGCDMNAVDLGMIGKWCKNLEGISLSKCKGVTDLGLSAAVAGCPNLKSIDLTCCREVTDIGLSSIASSCKGLVSLKLESCGNFTEHGLQMLCSSCELLEELDVTDSGLNDAGLKGIARCNRLKALKLGVCEEIHDTGLSYIASNCLDLRELDLYRSVEISDAGISEICSQCTKLTSLNMSYCTKVTDAGLSALARLQDLRVLELRGCTKLSSIGLFAVAKNCRNLLQLDLKRCTSIEEYVPLVLAQYCQNLRQVTLSYCSATDEGVVALAKGRCMQKMSLVHVRNVSVLGFSKLLVAGESLKKVKLPVHLGNSLPQQLIEQVENRGCKFQWMEKL
ncbi:hypothetical protein GOP47_0009393 [Adiantum capillus-veneris]|uniref:F-box/LRR-repeat protein 15-like leucin rich repeat domain-containing protein n=1 Tax=Adiantum capillus-veneris TaxID=13818 RepID=A0A9D4UX07_ADICA|nr:hypothetical protein GOP47_0009393 [Adiantum capillus-veneris]